MIDADALFKIGDTAEDEGDHELARRSFEQGTELGDENCMSRLAYIYDTGTGVAIDKGRALRLYIRAWRLGSSVAANNIAIIYKERENWRNSIRWCNRAADGRDFRAFLELAKFYLAGNGVEKSPEVALKLLRQCLSGPNLFEDDFEEANELIASLRPKLVR